MERRPVLLIEDDCDLLRLMRRAFERDGWRVRTAEDGRAGMKVFELDPPELVVTDIIMPTREASSHNSENAPAGRADPAISGGGGRRGRLPKAG